MNKCDEFLEAVKDVPFESRSYLELACQCEDQKKELEAKDKVIAELKEIVNIYKPIGDTPSYKDNRNYFYDEISAVLRR